MPLETETFGPDNDLSAAGYNALGLMMKGGKVDPETSASLSAADWNGIGRLLKSGRVKIGGAPAATAAPFVPPTSLYGGLNAAALANVPAPREPRPDGLSGHDALRQWQARQGIDPQTAAAMAAPDVSGGSVAPLASAMARVTPQEIANLRADVKARPGAYHPDAASQPFMVDDRAAVEAIARQRLNAPNQEYQAQGPSGAAGFVRGVDQSLARLYGPLAGGAVQQHALEVTQDLPAQGVGGWAGRQVGGAVKMATALHPAGISAIVSETAKQTWDSTGGDPYATAGSGLLSAATNTLGMKFADKLSADLVKRLGQSFLAEKGVGETTRRLLAEATAGAFDNVGRGEAQLVGDQAILALRGHQSAGQAFGHILDAQRDVIGDSVLSGAAGRVGFHAPGMIKEGMQQRQAARTGAEFDAWNQAGRDISKTVRTGSTPEPTVPLPDSLAWTKQRTTDGGNAAPDGATNSGTAQEPPNGRQEKGQGRQEGLLSPKTPDEIATAKAGVEPSVNDATTPPTDRTAPAAVRLEDMTNAELLAEAQRVGVKATKSRPTTIGRIREAVANGTSKGVPADGVVPGADVRAANEARPVGVAPADAAPVRGMGDGVAPVVPERGAVAGEGAGDVGAVASRPRTADEERARLALPQGVSVELRNIAPREADPTDAPFPRPAYSGGRQFVVSLGEHHSPAIEAKLASEGYTTWGSGGKIRLSKAEDAAPTESPGRRAMGRTSTLELADGRALSARYVMVEAGDLVPSHDARNGYTKNANGDLNERPYQDPTEGADSRATVERIAKGDKPHLLLADTPTATDGPPIVDPNRVVLGGNARSMGMQLAYHRGGPEAQSIRAATIEAAQRFGIDPAEAANFKNPVLVRMVSGKDAGERGSLSRALNQSLTTGRTADADAVSRGQKLTPEAASGVTRAIADESIDGALSDPRASMEIVRQLRKAGVFSEQDLTAYVQGGQLNAEGKQVIKRTLMGALIPDVRTLAETPPAVENMMIKSLGPSMRLLKATRGTGADFRGILDNALQAVSSKRQSGAKSIEDLVSQQTMIPEPWREDPRGLALAQMLDGNQPRKFTERLSALADAVEEAASGQIRLGGERPLTPAEAFDAAFGLDQPAESGAGRQGGLYGLPKRPSAEDAPNANAPRRPDETAQDYLLRRKSAWAEEATPFLFNKEQLKPFDKGASDANEPAPEPVNAERGGLFGMPLAGKGAGTTHAHAQSLAVKGDATVRVRASEIITKMEDALGGLPIRTGHGLHKQRQSAGWYDPGRDVVRLQSHNDLPTAAHEFGHAVHDISLGWNQPPRGAAHRELVAAGRALYGTRQPNGGYAREGVAEYVSKRLHGEDVARTMPESHKWFEQAVARHPKFVKEFGAVERMMNDWDLQGARGRVKAAVHETDTSLTGRTARAWKRAGEVLSLDNIRTMALDAGHPLRKAEGILTKETGRTLAPDQSPSMIYDALKGNAAGTAQAFVKHGAVNTAFNKVGPSLKEILQPVYFRRSDFIEYAVAKRAEILDARGKNPGVSMADAAESIRELQSPAFDNALAGVTEWSNHLINYVVESGGLSADQAKIIRDLNPIYVPFQRHFKASEMGGQGGTGQGKSYANTGQGVKRLKGSGREIEDPITSLTTQAEKMIALGNKMQVARAVAELGESAPGAAWFAEKIPTPREASSFSIEQVAKQLEDAGADLSAADLSQVLTAFSNSTQFNGKDNIVTIWRKGQREFWQLDPDVYKVLTSVNPDDILPALHVPLLSKGKRMVQLGATTGSTGFQARNFLKDIQSMIVNTQRKGAESLDPAAGARASWAMMKNDPDAVRWLSAGGNLTTMMGQDRNAAKRMMDEIMVEGFRGTVARTVLHPIDAMRAVGEYVESGPRLAEFRGKLKQAEAQYGVGSRAAVLEALLASKEVTVNFTRAGTVGEAINRIVPFFNARIQGTARFYKTFTTSPKGALASSLKAMAMITAPSLALWMVNKDEEWYQELPQYRKVGFWNFSLNGGKTIYSIPRAEMLGLVFGALPEATIDAAYRKDGRPVSDAVWAFVKNHTPLDNFASIPVAGPMAEHWANRSAFMDRPIVPEHERQTREPKDQYGPAQTELAKMLGQAFNVSPRLIEHDLAGMTGGAGLRAAQFAETLAGLRQFEDKQIPFVGGLIAVDPRGTGGRSVGDFYEALSTYRQRGNNVNGTPEDQRTAKVLEKGSEIMSALRKQWEAGVLTRDEYNRKALDTAKRILSVAGLRKGDPEAAPNLDRPAKSTP